jgi:DNA-directed RNA polymerase subunit D
MKIIKNTNEEICFAAEMSESLANAIRRSVLEIPVLAIDEVEFVKNDSVLYDEVLALRLGLLPLKMDKDMKMPDQCTCKGKGCSKCTIQLKLGAKEPGFVYSKELKGSAKPVYSDVPLVYLNEGQELELVAFARLGKGTEHTKYSPGLAYYRNVAELEGNKKDSKIIERYPKGILEFKDGEIKLIDKYKTDFYDTDKNLDFRIAPGKELVFCIESWGQMPAKEILFEAVKALKENLKELE